VLFDDQSILELEPGDNPVPDSFSGIAECVFIDQFRFSGLFVRLKGLSVARMSP